MNVRSVIVHNAPLFSTGTGFTRVSVPCEPWMQPDPPQVRVSQVKIIDRSEPEAKIIRAIKAGNLVFDDITHTAFGARNGGIDGFCRKMLLSMQDRGILTRERADLPGKPYHWRINNA